jgi:hypothetical protein
MNSKTFARFWRDVQISELTECWPWRRACDPDGYGIFVGDHHVSIRAHRFAFRCANGRDAKPMALHRCNNRVCCNPIHLYEGTAKDNIDDCIAAGNFRGGFVAGERHPNAKLKNADIAEVKRLVTLGHTQRAVAKQFGVSPSLINQIIKGKIHK